MSKSKGKGIADTASLRGFFRVQLTEAGKGVVGDSGWRENTTTNDGINQYVVNWLLGNTGSGKSVTHMALGTGTQPASNGTALSGEITHSASSRAAVSTSVVASRTAQFTAGFASTASFVTASVNISNVGLFNTSSRTTGTVFAGNTFTSSSCATNQNVNVTYQIRFASA